MSDIFEENDNEPRKNRHLLALLSGLGIGLLIGIIIAVLSIVFKREISILVYIGIGLVGITVNKFAPNKSLMGFITGAISCGFMMLSYLFVLGLAGYWYEDGSDLWITTGIAIIFGGIMGYKGNNSSEED